MRSSAGRVGGALAQGAIAVGSHSVGPPCSPGLGTAACGLCTQAASNRANSDGGASNGGVFFDQASGITTGTGTTGGGHIWIGGSST
eukprot:gene3031-4297_t